MERIADSQDILIVDEHGTTREGHLTQEEYRGAHLPLEGAKSITDLAHVVRKRSDMPTMPPYVESPRPGQIGHARLRSHPGRHGASASLEASSLAFEAENPGGPQLLLTRLHKRPGNASSGPTLPLPRPRPVFITEKPWVRS